MLNVARTGIDRNYGRKFWDWRRFFSKYFSGADVVLLPDNDEAGEKLTERIISDLIGVVNSIKVVKNI